MKEFKDKPKQLFNYVREKQKVKLGISRLENEEGNLTEDEKEAANVLNRFFQSVFTEEPDGDVPGLETNFIGDDMTFQRILLNMFKHTIIQQEMLKITVLIKQRKCFLIVQLEIVDLLFGIL